MSLGLQSLLPAFAGISPSPRPQASTRITTKIVTAGLRFSLGMIGAIAVSSQSASALPLGNAAEQPLVAPISTAGELASSPVDFTAIVALDNCSGSLVRFASSQPSDQALVLTNGHCYEGGFLQPGQVITHVPSSRSFALLNADASDNLGTLTADSVLYATMTDTDMTLYRLTQTYADIDSQYSVKPLTLAKTHPVAGTPIHVASGFWRRLYSCSIDGFVFELHEADWIFKDSIRYSAGGCKVIGGTSGSPIIADASREVIGINNTTNESGQECTENNPCEVDKQGGIAVKKGTGYGEEIYNLYSCLTPANDIDLSLASCALPKASN